MKPISIRLLSLIVVLALPQVTAADPLDEPACTNLRKEQTKLLADGLQTDMQRGPEWAKANLPQAKLDQIKHLMDVEEQLAFRCPRPKPVAPQPAAAGTEEDGGGESAPKPVKKKQPAKKKVEDEAATSGFDVFDAFNAPEAKEPETPPKKVSKPKKKEPANDAYVPPTATGNALAGEGYPEPKGPPGGASTTLSP